MGLFSVVDVYLEGPYAYNGSFKDHFYFGQLFFICLTMMLSAGYINAISIYGIFSYAITHMSGQTTGAAIKMIIGDYHMMATFMGNVLCFGVGALTAGLLTGTNKFTLGRQYATGFILQGLLLIAVTVDLLVGSQYAAQFMIAFACGLQNGLTSTYSNNLVRTTHITGMVIDVFYLVANWIRTRETTDMWRIKIFAPLYLAFMCGGFIGVAAFTMLGMHAMWLPAVYALFWGVLLFSLRGFKSPNQYVILDLPDLELLMI